MPDNLDNLNDLQKLKLAKDVFRRMGILHEIQVKQLEFIAIGYLGKSISKLISTGIQFDMDNPNLKHEVIFTVKAPKKTKAIKVPEALSLGVKMVLGDDFEVQIHLEGQND